MEKLFLRFPSTSVSKRLFAMMVKCFLKSEVFTFIYLWNLTLFLSQNCKELWSQIVLAKPRLSIWEQDIGEVLLRTLLKKPFFNGDLSVYWWDWNRLDLSLFLWAGHTPEYFHVVEWIHFELYWSVLGRGRASSVCDSWVSIVESLESHVNQNMEGHKFSFPKSNVVFIMANLLCYGQDRYASFLFLTYLMIQI